MITQIFQHTPLYVWAILGFLVYRGVLANRARDIDVRKMCIVPLVMLGLSLEGVRGAFGFDGEAPLVWLAGVLIGATLAWRFSDTARVVAYPERGSVRLAGSSMPLALMMAIFVMKYTVAVTLVIDPARRQQLAFIAPVCALYGLFSGIFIGGLLRHLAVYRAAGVTGASRIGAA